MSCRAFEETIARYVGGDLAPEEARPVERHLRGCAVCAELARELEEDRGRLSTRPPEAGDVDYAAMRRRIRQQIAIRQPRSRRLLPALLTAATILLAAAVATIRRAPQRIAPPTQIAQLPAAPVERTLAPAQARPLRRSRPARTARAAQPPPELTLEAAMRMFQELEPAPLAPPTGSDSPVEMRIATRNPNVTIILLQETKGDSQ